MGDLSQFVKKCDPKESRKRPVNKTSWKRTKEQQKRYTAKSLPKFTSCNHNQKAFRCTKLTCQDISRFHRNFYKCSSKLTQDAFILKYCHIKTAKRNKTNSKRKTSTKYHIINNQGLMIPVCFRTFLDALAIKKDRVKGVLGRFYNSGGNHPLENRGGDRKSEKYEAKKLSVQWFIEKFKGEESHYCRSKTQRIYLPPELNIRKMWRMYNNERDSDLKVKQGFFRNIFNSNYNIGFGNPRTDVCSTCICLQERIKCETDPAKKLQDMTEKRIHRLKYKAFYALLQEEHEHMKTISFDCQKNQALPKLPDQSAYYSRQFSFYNFTIVDGNSKSKLDKENVYSYYWNEVVHNKGGNEIISAVYNFLQNSTFDAKIKTLRVICDGCSGQNKNTGMVAMLGKWLYSEAPRHVKKVEIIFPVVGHSFIPPDRVFAKIEKTLKKKEVVTCPSEYVNVLNEHATAVDLSSIPVYDWKKSYEPVIKPTTSWHFPFMKSKRFFLTRSKTENILVQGEIAYKSEINKKRVVTKKNKKITMINPEMIEPNTIKPKKAKVQDVTKLLQKHFGLEWRNLPHLEYYKNIEDRSQSMHFDGFGTVPEVVDEQDILCEHGFEDVSNFV